MPNRAAGVIRLGLILAWRDLRSGPKHFRFFLLTLSLGVLLIAALQSLQSGFSNGLVRHGRALLGGDLSFSLIQHQANAQEQQWLASLGPLSTQIDMRTMARIDGQAPQLLELKVIDNHYPLAGTFITNPLDHSQLVTDDAGVVFVDPLLLLKTHLGINDIIYIGSQPLKIAGTIVSEPDKLSAGLALGLRAIIGRSDFEKTGLNRPGALLKWSYKIALRGEDITPADLTSIITSAHQRFAQTGWDIKSRINAAPQLAQTIEHISQFLLLIGLCALILGGLGIQQSIDAHLHSKNDDFAIFKAIGASSGLIIILASIQIVFYALCAALIGALIGTGLPTLAGPLFDHLGLPFDASWSASSLMTACAIGLLTALCFASLPLLRLKRRSVASLLRQSTAQSALRAKDYSIFSFNFALLLGFIYLTATDRTLTGDVMIGALVVMLILYLTDVVIAHLPLSRCQHLSPSWRMALDNIKRMAAIRRSFIMACGFAYTIMFMIGMVGTTLKNNINQHTTDQTPRYFIIDIAHDQLDAIMSFISTHSHMSAHTVPMMRGRLVAIKDLPIDSGHIDESARWIVEGDRGMTYARELPEGSQLIDGQWWPPLYQGEALVSIEQGAATALHLAPNDVVSFNILGKNLRARIANIRKVNWQSLGINFVFVFSPNSFQNLPFNDLMTLNAPPDAPEELTFIRDFNQAFPDPTLIPVRDALDAIAGTLSQLQLALLAAMSVIFGAALLAVLASLSTGYRLRLYETAIMRALGARRRHIALSLIIENALLSLYALVIGLILGCTGAFALLHFVFGLTNPGINALTLIIALAITLAMSIQISYLTLNKVLSQPPARALAEN